MKRLFTSVIFLLFVWSAFTQNATGNLSGFSSIVKNATRQEGFFTFYHDDAAGKIWLSVP